MAKKDKKTEPAVETPVEQPVAAPEAGSPLGALEEAELQAITQLRQASRDITTEIGTLEVRKARLLGNLGDMERRAQEILSGAGKRLGVEDGVAWHVTPEGKAFYGVGTK